MIETTKEGPVGDVMPMGVDSADTPTNEVVTENSLETEEEHWPHLFSDTEMQGFFQLDYHMGDHEVAARFPYEDIIASERRVPYRAIMVDPQAPMVEKLEAAGLLAYYFHDVFASCRIDDLITERVQQVEEDPRARDGTDNGREKAALLQAMLAQYYFGVATPDLSSKVLHVALPDGVLTRPGHIFSSVQDMYCELGLHRIRAKDYRKLRNKRAPKEGRIRADVPTGARITHRMQAAVDATAAALVFEVAEIFEKLRGEDIGWVGETQEDRELLLLSAEEIQSKYDSLVRSRFGLLGKNALQEETLFS